MPPFDLFLFPRRMRIHIDGFTEYLRFVPLNCFLSKQLSGPGHLVTENARGGKFAFPLLLNSEADTEAAGADHEILAREVEAG